MKEETKIEDILGKVMTDSVSGFKGTCVSITYYLTGCARVCLEGKEGDKTLTDYHFDLARVNLKKEKFVYKKAEKEKPAKGGYKPAPHKSGL